MQIVYVVLGEQRIIVVQRARRAYVCNLRQRRISWHGLKNSTKTSKGHTRGIMITSSHHRRLPDDGEHARSTRDAPTQSRAMNIQPSCATNPLYGSLLEQLGSRSITRTSAEPYYNPSKRTSPRTILPSPFSNVNTWNRSVSLRIAKMGKRISFIFYMQYLNLWFIKFNIVRIFRYDL